MAMASAVLAFFDGGLDVDVCFDVVGCVRLLLCSRVPAFVVVVEDVVDVDNVDGVVAEKFDVCDDIWGGHKCTTQQGGRDRFSCITSRVHSLTFSIKPCSELIFSIAVSN